MADAGRDAERTRTALGRTETVAVSTRPFEVGAELGADDVVWRALPLAAVPDDALTRGEDHPVAGRVVRDPIGANEVLTHARVGPDDVSGPTALVPAEHRAVAIPISLGVPPVEVGDRVDVVATGESFDGRVEGVTLARRARVVAVDEEQVTVAVPTRAAPETVAALTTGAVTVVLVGG